MSAPRRRAALDPRLSTIVGHVVQRLAAAAEEDLQARYDLGEVVLSLRGVGSRSAIRLLAEHLGSDASALRRYARVTRTIGADEFRWLVSLRTPRGVPLSWSHVELLAQDPDLERRKGLAAAVTREDLTVRQLAARLPASTRANRS
jgi:hypothetical protein